MERFRRWFHVLISLIILAVIVRSLGTRQVWMLVARCRWSDLGIAIVISQLALIIRAWRWKVILDHQGTAVPLARMYLLTTVGVALNTVLPANSGDVLKSYYGFQWTGRKEGMVSTAVVDKLVALFAAFLLGTIASLALGLKGYTAFNLALVGLTGCIAFLPALFPWTLLARVASIARIRLDVEKLRAAMSMSFPIKCQTTLLSVGAWGLTFLQFYFVMTALHHLIPLTTVFAVLPVVNLSKFTPFTLDGLGAQEALMTYLFGRFGTPGAAAFAGSLVSRAVAVLLPTLVGTMTILLSGTGKPILEGD